MKDQNKYSFCIVTYETFPNPSTQNLKTYLIENFHVDILYIHHPMLDTEEGYSMSSGYELYKDNKLVRSVNAYHWKLFWPLLYMKDVLYTLLWIFINRIKFDVYVASGNLNPVAGIILRNLGLVKKVIYITLDYYSDRFKNRIVNRIFFQLDKFCVRFSDETWNVSSSMVVAREVEMGMDRKIYSRQRTVPGGVWFYKTKRLKFDEINLNKIVYRGVLLPHMGVELVIRAMPLILKEAPDLVFEIVGTGPEEKVLQELAEDLKVSKSIVFHGYVEGRENMEEILSNGALGMATFNTDMLREKVKNSDPGKIKDYMLLGMPVITTNVTNFSKVVADDKCGIVVDYLPADVAKAVLKLIKNKKLLKQYRQNATKFIEMLDCNNIYNINLGRVISNLNKSSGR